MSHQFLHFSGIDSCDADLNVNSSVSSVLLCSHNLHALLSCKVAKGQMLQELSSLMQEESKQRFLIGTLTKYIQGPHVFLSKILCKSPNGHKLVLERGVPKWEFFNLPAHFHKGSPCVKMGTVVLTAH
jgi:hypothetical protein